MAQFPALVDAWKNFTSKLSSEPAKIDWEAVKREAPPLIAEKSYTDFSFDTTLFGAAEYYRRHGYDRLAAMLSAGLPGWANEVVTYETAQNLPAVYACRRIICETTASLPARLIVRDNNKITIRKDLPISKVLRWGNDERSAFQMMDTWMSHLLFAGNAYAQIIRRSGGDRSALNLNLLTPDQVLPEREKGGRRRLMYVVTQVGQPDQTFYVTPGEPHDILHIRGAGYDGLKGHSLIELARQTFSSGLGMEKNWGRFLANGGRVPYLLKKATKFENDAKRKEYRASWEKAYSEPHIPPIMEGDMTFEKLGLSMSEMQLLESRQFSVIDICRWFGVSPTLVFDLTKANYNSLEQLIRSFINFTLRGWMDRVAGDWRRCVLTPAERDQGIELHFSLNELTRGDFQARFAAYGQGLINGVFSINEARELEGMEPIAGLDGHNVQQQMVAAQNAGAGLPQDPDAIEIEEDEAGED